MGRRGLLRGILEDPTARMALMARNIRAAQAREGVDTTLEQAERAYLSVLKALRHDLRDRPVA